MSQRLKQLRDERATLNEQSKAILDKAETEKRDLSAEEKAQWDRLDSRIDEINGEVERREKSEARQTALSASRGREADPDDVDDGRAGRRNADPGEPITFDLRGRKVQIKPGTPEAVRCGDPYVSAFADYVASGGKRTNGLFTGNDAKGGYLAPTTWVMDLIKALDNSVFMRQLATVLPPMTTGASLGFPTLDTDPGDDDWTDEVPASDISEDDNLTLGKREFVPHLLTKMVKVSRKLIRAAVMDPVQIVFERLLYVEQITEEKAFLTGNGVKRPLGVFTASSHGISTGRDVACASTTEPAGDDIINALYSLKEQYMRNATGIFHRDMVKRIRKLKTGDGQYLWQPGIAAGQPNTILDRPFVMSEYAPNTFTTGQYIGIFGDFKAGYWIADSLAHEIEILDQLFALKNQNGFVSRKETDGAPVLEEAFARIKLA